MLRRMWNKGSTASLLGRVHNWTASLGSSVPLINSSLSFKNSQSCSIIIKISKITLLLSHFRCGELGNSHIKSKILKTAIQSYFLLNVQHQRLTHNIMHFKQLNYQQLSNYAIYSTHSLSSRLSPAPFNMYSCIFLHIHSLDISIKFESSTEMRMHIQ